MSISSHIPRFGGDGMHSVAAATAYHLAQFDKRCGSRHNNYDIKWI